ncbi:hypothetical protein CW749_25700 [Vibrio sp. vnigr-6D03]|nr:hypothetical protein CW749_25700 [Vibrio sp. vnigr-6D03]
MYLLVILSKYLATKSKRHRNEPFGQNLWLISTALSLIDVERLHRMSVALYKSPTNCYKNHLERSTDPKDLILFKPF